MRYPYGEGKEYFKYSLFIVFCNRLLTCTVCAVITMVRHMQAIEVIHSNWVEPKLTLQLATIMIL